MAGVPSTWWYRYTPTMKGPYTFYVTFAGTGTYASSDSRPSCVKVTVK